MATAKKANAGKSAKKLTKRAMPARKSSQKRAAPVKAAAAKVAKTAEEVPKLKPLSPQHALFVSEFLKDRSATKAAIRAGYSEKTAGQIGYQLLQNPSIRAAIDEGLDKLLTDNGLTAARVLKEMARLAFFDPAKLYDKDGKLLPITQVDEDTRAAIAAIEIEGTRTSKAGETAKVKLTDKGAALRMAAQHFGLLKEHVELTGKDGGPIETRELSDPERAVRLAKILAAARARVKK
jgi:phage terminase small subunit